MTTTATILAMIERAQLQVDALDTLAGGMAAGLRVGVVDADHLYTLLSTQADAIKANLVELASFVERSPARTEANDSERGTSYMPTMVGIVGKR